LPKKLSLTVLFYIFVSTGLVIGGQACTPETNFKISPEYEVSGPDPYFSYQWFLQADGKTNHWNIDSDVVWESGNHGEGVNICVVDPSSIYLRHSDLNSNKDLQKSFNFLVRSRTTDTTIPGGESHGTCAAGVIGAREENSKGIIGVASRANISARTTSGSEADILDALSYQAATTDVSSNSYGPSDATAQVNQYYNVQSFKDGINIGLNSGRRGLGTIFVWAAGNGRRNSDRSNYDGYASNSGVLSICSVGKSGAVSVFSEPGSNLWVCAPGEWIPSTDYKGLKCSDGPEVKSDFADTDYTATFTGTSAAAPVVSGVVGLILKEAALQNKQLGWRDVRIILAKSAQKPQGVTWQPTGIGFNDDYGFGIVNAKNAVALVKNWTSVGTGNWTAENLSAAYLTPTGSGSFDVASGYVALNKYTISPAAVNFIEHIDLQIQMTHTDPGALEANLVYKPLDASKSVVSKILTPHSCLDSQGSTVSCQGGSNLTYTFGVANFLGESAQGTWELQIKNNNGNSAGGSISGWRLKIYGH
jgi:subtilisin-like proprotein convertase family protein